MVDSTTDGILPNEILADLLFAQALNHRAFRREDEAQQCLDQLLRFDPEHIPALNEKGLARMAQCDLEKATQCFLKILEIEPHDPYAANRLGMLFREKGNLDGAEALFRDALQFNPYNPHILTQLALNLHEQGRLPEAAEHLLRAQKCRNIGNQVSHQAELLAKYMAPGVVIAGLAHEIRNVLHSSNLAFRLLRKDLLELREDQTVQSVAERINRLEANFNRIGYLIRHFREVVRGDGPSRERLQISEIIEFAFKLLGEKLNNTGIRWQIDEETDLPLIAGNRIELEQVFINLISNAFDALTSQPTSSPMIAIRAFPLPTEQLLVVEVIDNGPGIPPAAVPRLFDLSFTTKKSGSGVGLWLCNFAVERADGRITLEESSPGHTMFRLEFPIGEETDDET